MEKTETKFYIIENASNVNYGTSLEKAIRYYMSEYDHTLIDESAIDNLERQIQEWTDLLLAEHKQWKRQDVSRYQLPFSDHIMLKVGVAMLRLRPAKFIINP